MITVRKAEKTDCHFLARIILLAESTGFEITSYTGMFGKTTEELVPSFEKMIDNDTDGHPLTYKSYLIACVDGIPASAISVYKEGEFGDSNHLMTGALMTGFDRKSVALAFGFLKNHGDITIQKTPGTLQIDCVATMPEYRGKGLLKELMKAAEQRGKELNTGEIQIQVWKKNEGAVAAYEKAGYKIVKEMMSAVDEGNGKILMIKNI
ncbi:MAG: acetyltransferase, superfamily protein [Bacteroidetes bacterium]|jgi:ribosomal protein S18 acetylase RimI-like enzyme|nr:acetyltransferase, superfamily protein [Bacteroidota bacterium]